MANTNFTAEQQRGISNYEKAISDLKSSGQFSLANQKAARETLKSTYGVGLNANGYFIINPTNTTTTPTATQPAQTTQTSTQNLSNNQSQRDTLQKGWDAYTYEQQQEKLSQSKNLASDLAKYGITNKSAPTPTGTTQTGLNYQDDSEDRMEQIVSNLNNYYDNPNTRYLFSNYDDYYNYFIKDKGRSQAQVDLLNSYFSDKNKYNQFDAYTPEQIANGYLNGQVGNDYISYLKSTNPEAYNQLQGLIQQNTYQIENQSTLESIAKSAGFTGFESYASMMGYKDDNKNGIYDILETSMSDEEKEYRNQYIDLDAQYTELQLMKDKVLDDLTAAYPGVSKTTLMLMADDRTTDLNQKMNELTIKMKQVNGYIQTLQADRELQQKTAQAQLEAMSDLYGMYYKYTPEGMSELAQAEYAATNITLDQAQTDTQKQMALQNVLDGYYEKYGDIIQRSEAQVINDVMRVSREEGISISDALEKNFMTPLRNKPQYKAMSAGGAGIEWTKIGEDSDGNTIYGFVDTSTQTVTPYGGTIGSGISGGTLGASGGLSAVSNFEKQLSDKGYNLGDSIREGWCGEPVNDYLSSIGDLMHYDNNKSTKLNSITPNAGPQVGAIAIWDEPGTEDGNKYGHVAIVTEVGDGTITVLESNKSTGLRYKTYSQNNVTGYYIPKSIKGGTTGGTDKSGGFINTDAAKGFYEEYIGLTSGLAKTSGSQTRIKQIMNELGISSETQLASQAKAYWRQKDMATVEPTLQIIDEMIANAANLPDSDTRKYLGTSANPGARPIGSFAGDVIYNSMSKADKNAYNSWASEYDYLLSNLTLENLIDAKSKGATFGSLTEGEWSLLKTAVGKLQLGLSQDDYVKALKELRTALSSPYSEYLGGGSSAYQSTNYSQNMGNTYNTMSDLMSAFGFNSY